MDVFDAAHLNPFKTPFFSVVMSVMSTIFQPHSNHSDATRAEQLGGDETLGLLSLGGIEAVKPWATQA